MIKNILNSFKLHNWDDTILDAFDEEEEDEDDDTVTEDHKGQGNEKNHLGSIKFWYQNLW